MAVASCCQQGHHSPCWTASDSLLLTSRLFTNFITKRPRQEAKLTELQKGYVRFTTSALYVSECGCEGAPAAPAAAGGSGQRQAVSGRWSVASHPHPSQPSGAQHLSNTSLSSLEWRQTAMATFSNGYRQMGRPFGICGTRHQSKQATMEMFGGAFTSQARLRPTGVAFILRAGTVGYTPVGAAHGGYSWGQIPGQPSTTLSAISGSERSRNGSTQRAKQQSQ